jgi:histidine triad (HIT) family protein
LGNIHEIGQAFAEWTITTAMLLHCDSNLPTSKTVAKTLFEKIINRDIPATIVHEDEHCVAFRDINPGAPVHILLVPRKPLPRLCDAGIEDQALLGHMMLCANRIAAAEGFGEAFRLVVNNGAEAGQSVFHLHLHIIAGRPLSWPPG